MKVTKLPLPSPWNTDAAVFHLYRAWSNRGSVQLQHIVLPNPMMVQSLAALWRRHHEATDVQRGEVPRGTLTGIGSWQLFQQQDGSGVIVIEAVSQDSS